jgi:NitT/TauT family transport system ATP-binding protein
MGFQCQQISKKFISIQGDVIALDGLNLTVGNQEFVCIVGPSGCGKTTLLRIIAGLVRPTTGTVVFDQEITNRPRCSMVFQDQGLFPWMSVVDNVAFGLEMQKVNREERTTQAKKFLERVGLGEFLKAYPHELSGGMRQRVAILRAFLSNPEILLMDEPFGALDSQTRLLMQEELLRIWKEHQKTVVYITHDIQEAILLGDRVLVMTGRPGKIRADIPIDIARPRNIKDIDRPDVVEIHWKIWKMIEDDVRTDLRITS